MKTQPTGFDLPRDGVGWVFVCIVPIENEAFIPARTTQYRATKGQPGDGNHLGYKPTTDRVA